MKAAAYNRSRFGIGFTLRDLPLDWAGTQLLSSFDLDGDLALSKKELDTVGDLYVVPRDARRIPGR